MNRLPPYLVWHIKSYLNIQCNGPCHLSSGTLLRGVATARTKLDLNHKCVTTRSFNTSRYYPAEDRDHAKHGEYSEFVIMDDPMSPMEQDRQPTLVRGDVPGRDEDMQIMTPHPDETLEQTVSEIRTLLYQTPDDPIPASTLALAHLQSFPRNLLLTPTAQPFLHRTFHTLLQPFLIHPFGYLSIPPLLAFTHDFVQSPITPQIRIAIITKHITDPLWTNSIMHVVNLNQMPRGPLQTLFALLEWGVEHVEIVRLLDEVLRFQQGLDEGKVPEMTGEGFLLLFRSLGISKDFQASIELLKRYREFITSHKGFGDLFDLDGEMSGMDLEKVVTPYLNTLHTWTHSRFKFDVISDSDLRKGVRRNEVRMSSTVPREIIKDLRDLVGEGLFERVPMRLLITWMTAERVAGNHKAALGVWGLIRSRKVEVDEETEMEMEREWEGKCEGEGEDEAENERKREERKERGKRARVVQDDKRKAITEVLKLYKTQGLGKEEMRVRVGEVLREMKRIGILNGKGVEGVLSTICASEEVDMPLVLAILRMITGVGAVVHNVEDFTVTQSKDTDTPRIETDTIDTDVSSSGPIRVKPIIPSTRTISILIAHLIKLWEKLDGRIPLLDRLLADLGDYASTSQLVRLRGNFIYAKRYLRSGDTMLGVIPEEWEMMSRVLDSLRREEQGGGAMGLRIVLPNLVEVERHNPSRAMTKGKKAFGLRGIDGVGQGIRVSTWKSPVAREQAEEYRIRHQINTDAMLRATVVLVEKVLRVFIQHEMRVDGLKVEDIEIEVERRLERTMLDVRDDLDV